MLRSHLQMHTISLSTQKGCYHRLVYVKYCWACKYNIFPLIVIKFFTFKCLKIKINIIKLTILRHSIYESKNKILEIFKLSPKSQKSKLYYLIPYSHSHINSNLIQINHNYNVYLAGCGNTWRKTKKTIRLFMLRIKRTIHGLKKENALLCKT